MADQLYGATRARRFDCGSAGAAALCCALILLVPSAQIGAAEIPPGASPGGALPRDLNRQDFPQEGPSFPIPPVYDRPIDVEGGERIFVNEFRITGVVDDPTSGISADEVALLAQARLAEVKALAETLRREKQQLDAVDTGGFTDDERDRMSSVMDQVLNTVDPQQQMQMLQSLVTELRFARFDREAGLTIGNLQQVADALTEYYRERGHFLARAIVPAQEVREGLVEIRILEGRFGRAIVDGNESYDAETLTRFFSHLEGELVTRERIESPLYRVNDLPGVNVTGVFQPGEEVGTSDLVLNVQRERPVDFTMRFDNHVSEFTGDARFIGELTWNNPIGGGDKIDMVVLQTLKPEGSLFGAITYTRPMADPSWSWHLGASRNRFDVAGQLLTAGVQIGGQSESASFGFDRAIVRSRFFNLYGGFDLSVKRAEILESGIATRRDRLTTLGAQLNWDRILTESRALETGYVRIDVGLPELFNAFENSILRQLQGGNPDVLANLSPSDLIPPSRQGGSGRFASSSYSKLSWDYQRLKALSSTDSNQTVFFRVSGQYSPDLLTSLEQYSIGGPQNMRALPVSSFLVDSALYSTLEWTIRPFGGSGRTSIGGRPWSQTTSFTLFYDRLLAWVNDPIESTELHNYSFGGYGASLGFDFGKLRMRVIASRLRIGEDAVLPSGTDILPEQDDRDTQVWFELSYTY